MNERLSNKGLISGSGLKIIAIISMILDHSAKYLLNDLGIGKATLLTIGHTKISGLFIMSSILGRIAFPLFAFLAVEGYRHTRNFKKYALSLLFFGLISYIPSNLMHGWNMFSINHSNVMFTLLLGILCIRAIDKLEMWKACIICIVLMALSLIIKTDYRVFGIALIILLHILKKREFQCLAIIATFCNKISSFAASLACIPIMLYNGKRGFIKGQFGKYFFYAIYPLHMVLIAFLRHLLV